MYAHPLLSFSDLYILSVFDRFQSCLLMIDDSTNQMSPEVVRPRKGWELKKSDLWAIGVCSANSVHPNDHCLWFKKRCDHIRVGCWSTSIPRELASKDHGSDRVAQ